jgi:hypothetical protein
MVEKIGHKKLISRSRLDWINEGKASTVVLEHEALQNVEDVPSRSSTEFTLATLPCQASIAKTGLGEVEDVGRGDKTGHEEVDNPAEQLNPHYGEDDLDALIAEAEIVDNQKRKQNNTRYENAKQEIFEEDEEAMAELESLW